MAEARITEFFGETQIREEVLDFMGLGSCMPREAWRLPSPQPLQYPTRIAYQKQHKQHLQYLYTLYVGRAPHVAYYVA